MLIPLLYSHPCEYGRLGRDQSPGKSKLSSAMESKELPMKESLLAKEVGDCTLSLHGNGNDAS